MRILGIETSCDETAAAVIEVIEPRTQNLGPNFQVLSNVIASQIKIHRKTGGVVPEVAARAHVEKIVPVVEQALAQSHPLLSPPPSRGRKNVDIDAIAVTAGPGLMTSLLVGVEVARTLSWLWKKPVVAVNHLAGHVYANWLPSITRHSEGAARRLKNPVLKSTGSFARLRMTNISFPALALIVSGGHTELVLMRRHLDFKIIGSTRDDAAGEAFDKVAKMLGLPYPGGPEVSKFAAQGSPNAIEFPRPMIKSNDFDFSFSGLKTSVLYYLRSAGVYPPQAAHKVPRYKLAEVCYEFQEAAVDVLVAKTIRAAKQYKVKTVMLGGGVAANQRLREQLVQTIQSELPATSYVLPPLQFTTDNAAMIAAAGYFMARAKQFTPWQKLEVDPNWELGQKFRPISR